MKATRMTTRSASSTSKQLAAEDLDTKPPAKKKKSCHTKIASADRTDQNPALPLEAFSVTMEYLRPRDLFNTAFTCKTLRDAVTTRAVLNSALRYGKYARRSMSEIQKLMKNHSIYVPSPMRLLRFACGTHCENCFQNRVNFVRPNYGLFVCFDCLKGGLTKIWRYTRTQEEICTRDQYDALFRHSRVAFYPYEDSRYVLVEPKSDVIGESIGPIVTLEDIDEMVVHSDGFDDYITTVLGAPERDAYNEFTLAFEEIEGVVNGIILGKETAKLERKRLKQERSDTNTTKKHESIDKMLGDLTELIDEPFREITLKRELLSAPSKRRYAKMHVPFVDDVLEPYILAPSKARKKVLKEVADEINSKFQMILDKDFLSLSFLSDEEPFESRLKHFFRGNIGPSLSDLVNFKMENHSNDKVCRVTSEFLSLIDNDKFVEALNHLAEGLHFVLFHDFRERGHPSSSYLTRDLEYQNKFSRYVWQKELEVQKGEEGADLYKSAFVTLHFKFKDLWYSILNYESWMNEDNQPGYMRKYLLETSYHFERNGDYMLLTESFHSLCDEQWDFWRYERRNDRSWDRRW
ncbi:hypothetical protein ACHAXS_007725 [Conticribra weissflogii]